MSLLEDHLFRFYVSIHPEPVSFKDYITKSGFCPIRTKVVGKFCKNSKCFVTGFPVKYLPTKIILSVR